MRRAFWLLLLVASCAGMGAAIQDAGVPAAGAAGGAAAGVALGFSGGVVALLSALGAAIGSLLDQAGEGQQITQMGLEQLAPFGLSAIISALFWPVLAILAAIWFFPAPHRIVKAIWSQIKRMRVERHQDRGAEED